MTSKSSKLKKERIEAMNREELREEFVQTLLGSVMPLVEQVIKQRIYQWFDVIADYQPKEKTDAA